MIVLALLLLLSATASANAEVAVTVDNEQHTFDSREADFGPDLSDNGVMGVLQVANPLDGCSEMDPPRMNDSSFIAIIQRGASGAASPCLFGDKIRNAQKVGFMAVIVYDNVNEELMTMASKEPASIPSVFVSLSSGQELVQLEGQVARITPDKRLHWPTYIVSFAVIISSAFLILAFVVFYRRCYMRRRPHAVVVIDSARIAKLPTRIAGPINADPHNREICCICLEEHAEGDLLTVLPCSHAFHKKCIEPWLLQNHRTCPICKRDPCPSERTRLLDTANV